MSDIRTGGPAFPCGHQSGMTLRDYNAAKAMQTLLGSEYTSEHGLHEGWMYAMAHEAYMVADAMLKAREQ